MLLIYDHKCSICRKLAYNIYINSNKAINIQALSNPDTADILGRFYPDGWPHDFYIVDGDTCRRGVRGLIKLYKSVGPKQTLGILSEYASFKLRPKYAQVPQASRRNMLRSMALAPLAAGFSKFALAEPATSTPDGAFRINIARTQPGGGSNGWSASASKCDECIRSSPKIWHANAEHNRTSSGENCPTTSYCILAIRRQ